MNIITLLRPGIVLIIFFFNENLSAQGNFFEAGSRKKKIEIITAWGEETTRLAYDRNFRASTDVFYIVQKYATRAEFIGFHDTIFTRFFGKSFVELTDREKEEISDILNLDGPAASKLHYPEAFIYPFGPSGRRSKFITSEGQTKALTYINEMNRKTILPTVTGKEVIESACLGFKVIDAVYENSGRGFLVTEIKLGGPAFLAGIQPSDMILSFINPLAGESEKAYGAELLPIRSAAELKNRSCGAVDVAFVPFNLMYKDPAGKGYLPFTGDLLFGLPEVAGAWVSSVIADRPAGYIGRSVTQYDNMGVHGRSDKRIDALWYSNYRWPKRNQVNGLTDSIQKIKLRYEAGVKELLGKASSISCVYDDASDAFQRIEKEAANLDKLQLLFDGNTKRRTIQQVKTTIDSRCAGEWWNMGGDNAKRVVRSIINNNENEWREHESTELKSDNWEHCVEVLFVELQNVYKRDCLAKFPEPTDTFKLEVSAVSDIVWRNRWGIETMRIPGREAETYYYYSRKKYSSAYLDVFNNLRTNNALIRFLSGEMSVVNEMANYVSMLLNKYGCDSPQVKEFESKLFHALIFLNPGSKNKYLNEFKAYQGNSYPYTY